MAIKSTLQAWNIIARNNLQNQLLTPSASILFVIGKFANFLFSVVTIFAIFSATKTVNGYNLNQAVIVVLVYNLIESLVQFLFRAIYMFRPVLVKGDYDLDLLKPLPSFFRPLIAGPDFLDFPPMVIQGLALLFFYLKLGFYRQPTDILIFLFFVLTSIIISFFTLLIIAAFCILTTEVDNLTWIFRSLMRAGTVPTDVYRGGFLFLLNFLVPVTIIATIPAKSLLGLLTPNLIIYAVTLTVLFSVFSWSFWRYALRHYTSASS